MEMTTLSVTTLSQAVVVGRLRRTSSPVFAGVRGGAVSILGSRLAGDSARRRILMV
jgi:hypothetical protein